MHPEIVVSTVPEVNVKSERPTNLTEEDQRKLGKWEKRFHTAGVIVAFVGRVIPKK